MATAQHKATSAITSAEEQNFKGNKQFAKKGNDPLKKHKKQPVQTFGSAQSNICDHKC
jgi:hypothetical protein